MRSTGKCVSGSPLSLSHLRAAEHINRRPAKSEGGAKRHGGSPQAGGLLRPALEMDVPALALWEPVLLGIGRTYRQEHAEAVAPQAKTQGLLRSRQI
jgi:hypothetical protein